jgi:hypothetical protein
MAQDKQLAWNLYYSYENFKEQTLTNRRFKHSDIIPLIERLKNNKIFRVDKAGESAEGRDIYLISAGKGKKKVFLWSQMHGDEPTATAVLFDIFNFFLNTTEYIEFKEFLLSNLTIYFLPMLNPDGAEQFQRRNIFEIDLNRDVLRQQTPEARILKGVFDTLKADFGFNLHDQGRNYAAGNSFNTASISFLAPSPDLEKSLTPARENAMRLIGGLSQILNEFIPGHIAKYSDDYEPRAFGDNFTKLGTSVVLLESGGWRADREKQFLRKMNYITLITAFNFIAAGTFAGFDLNLYESIPMNEELMMDLILRNLKMQKNGIEYVVDIGVNFEEINLKGAKDFYLKASIEDIGDLSVFSGYEEFDFSGCTIEPGKLYPGEPVSVYDLDKFDVNGLFSRGYTSVKVKPGVYNKEFSDFKFNLVSDFNSFSNDEIKVEGAADFVIKKNNLVTHAIVNGFIHDMKNLSSSEGNALFYK